MPLKLQYHLISPLFLYSLWILCVANPAFIFIICIHIISCYFDIVHVNQPPFFIISKFYFIFYMYTYDILRFDTHWVVRADALKVHGFERRVPHQYLGKNPPEISMRRVLKPETWQQHGDLTPEFVSLSNTNWTDWWFGTWMDYDFPYIYIYWEFHHPNWRSPSFFRGLGLNHQAVEVSMGKMGETWRRSFSGWRNIHGWCLLLHIAAWYIYICICMYHY